MRWQHHEGSGNVEDRRGQSPVGRLGGLPLGGRSSVIVLLVVLVAGYYGVDLTGLLSDGSMVTPVPSTTSSGQEQELARFTSVVLKTTENAWQDIFRRSGNAYPPPKLVLYTGATETACGYGQSAMGPFYCPGDGNVYIDLAFYRDMQTRLGGGGDFALGYVLAHEVGHHVQNVLGIARKVREMQRGVSQAEANRLSVMMELQADCFAGVWGRSVQREGMLESGDLEEALNTAAAIGDDRLQRQQTGRVVPDSFTHGTSQQRYAWFKRGFDTGDPGQCNTYNGLR
ncbi:MAG: neutral zinc metallopeptidase [Desulfovibrio sp.]|nr:neutral zinc metallopeptidase [Desulfovibrio sp.]